MVEPRRFLGDNIFLVAAVLLPLVVAAFFVLSTVLPAWSVPPPQHDLLLRAGAPYDQTRPPLAIDIAVRDGRVEATVRALPTSSWPQPWKLFLFDHTTLRVREIAIDLPATMVPEDPPRTIVVDMPGGRRVLTDPVAPDGYRFDTDRGSGPGLIGDLFGRRYETSAVLVNRGRRVRLDLPTPYEYLSPVHVVGWLEPEGPR